VLYPAISLNLEILINGGVISQFCSRAIGSGIVLTDNTPSIYIDTSSKSGDRDRNI
jgi:hypothetical protein